METQLLIERLSAAFPEQLDMSGGQVRRGTGTIHSLVVPINTETTMRGDVIQPNINIINSYNGECSLKLDIGFTRLVCLNGMRVGSSLFNRRVRHVTGQKMNDFLLSFEDSVAETLGAVDSEVKRIEELSSQEVTKEDALRIIYKLQDAGVITRAAGHSADWVFFTGNFRRPADREQSNTLFGLWNVINEEMEQTRTSRTTDFSLLKRNDKLLPAILLAADEVAA